MQYTDNVLLMMLEQEVAELKERLLAGPGMPLTPNSS